MDGIGLGEAIKALREELTEAKGEGDGSWMRFQVSPVELELQLVVTKDADAKIGWKVLEAGASIGSERTQKINLTLTPQWWDPSEGQYSADWLVSGVASAPNAAPSGSIEVVGVPDTHSQPEDA